MVPVIPLVRSSAPTPNSKPIKPLLRRSTLSGTIRKADDAGLDDDILSAPPSPSKKPRVSFNPNVDTKVMEEYQVKGRSLESVRGEVKQALQAHTKGDSEGYDVIKEVFAPRREDDEDDDEAEAKADIKAYVLALTTYASLLNKNCSDLVKVVLGCEWMGRDESFVKSYVYFLGSLASAQGAYVSMVLGMLVNYFYGGKVSSVGEKRA
jgi:RNA polymerase I-specific transcription initiation factor RRN3